ncbi:MAG TPA: ATPase [Cyanobacteria bacterium UBA8803]|nr:ATPase [Cyanobacteria bacterium UBA9273]HBL59246.1 ATPase [Cyanobacteria bacterium UBA8803]
MKIKKLIKEALSLPTTTIAYYVSQQLAEFYPDKAAIEGTDCSFDLEIYAKDQKCTIRQKNLIHNQISTHWDGLTKNIYKSAENAYFNVTWQEHNLEVLLMTWREGWQNIRYYWILADTAEISESFFAAVCEWNAQIREEVLVFEEGHWQKSSSLFQAIKGATFDNLILRGTLKQDLQDDLISFFAARSTYQAYGVPWKRGILLIGSPGNGKTHTVKALINKLQQPCLYVKSFKSQYETDNDNIRKAFDKARQSAPCILVLEDLDSLVDKDNRSFFLNELDGFAVNAGIITLATTNHPDRLDPAILDRPSRFDRKYHFDLPAFTERLAYIDLWNNTLKQGMRLSDSAMSHIAEITDGFSFAYLKELFVSSMVRWMGAMESGAMTKIMPEQVVLLREQMNSAMKDLEPENS